MIDEIQESSKIYSRIREFARDFQCHFAVTGSYLGKTVEKEYLLPAESNKMTKRSINQAVAWLYRSDIIGYCGKVIACDTSDTRANARFYFRDLGVSNYFLKAGGIKKAAAVYFLKGGLMESRMAG